MNKDFYKTLGVEKSANEDDIKKAYRKLAHQHHPDKTGGNAQKFKEINEAYQVLSNAQKRSQYDRFGQNFSAQGGPASGWDGAGFEGFSAQSGSAGGWDFSNMEGMGDVGDIFEAFFGGMGGGRKRKTYHRGADIEILKDITLEEAFRGDAMKLNYETLGLCAECKGLGSSKDAGATKCSTCEGKGEIRETRSSFFGQFSQVRECGSCKGQGEIPNKICKHCNGAGRVKSAKEISVNIAQGISDGQLIKVSGAGQAGERGAGVGDLYVRIRVKPHHSFKRVGDDLLVRKNLDILKVLAGEKVEIPTISGGKLNLEIPAGFNLREQMRISGEGMPHLGHYGRGDLYVEFDVKVPKVDAKIKKVLGE